MLMSQKGTIGKEKGSRAGTCAVAGLNPFSSFSERVWSSYDSY